MANSDDNKRDKWLKRLSDENKAHEVFRKRAKEADRAFCNYESDADAPKAPLFPSTINIIHGKIYAQPPKPDIRKRHPSSPFVAPSAAVPAGPPGIAPSAPGSQPPAGPPIPPMGGSPASGGQGGTSQGAPAQSPQGVSGLPGPMVPAGLGQPGSGSPLSPVADSIGDDNIIAMALERCLQYTIDSTLFDDDGHHAVNDFLVAGLGCAKVEMHTETEEVPVVNPITGDEVVDGEGNVVTQSVITYQCLNLRHFSWGQFRWEPSKDWRRVCWVAFDHFLTKDDIEKMFDVTLDDKANNNDSSNQREEGAASGLSQPAMDKYEGVYVVHEIWDKRTKSRLFVTDAYDDVLAEEPDPLELEDFFPCPRPMMSLQNGREIVPCPEYWQCAFLFDQLTEISDRIYNILRQVKDIGFYDDSFTDLQKLTDYDDGTIIPVKNLLDKMRALNGSAKADSVLYQVDMTAKVGVLAQLLQQYATVKQRIDEWWGIADIEQGSSNPNDTATAQTIKDQWANVRNGQRVQKVALFFRDVFCIMAELIANKFDRAQIQAMCGISLSDAQVATMRSDLARAYVIDVQSDSTMLENDTQNAQDLTQFLQAFTGYMNQMAPAVKQGMLPADLAKEILSLIVDAYKPGRSLQQAVDALPSTLDQLNQLTGQLQQAQQQAQQAQKQLQDYQQGEEARKNAQTQADVAEKQVNTAAKAQKLKTDGIQDAAKASQASRQDIVDGMMTGIH